MHLIWRTKGYEPLYTEMTDHPTLYPVDRWAARWLSMMTVRSRPGWPRLGISNPWFRRESASMTRTYAAGYDVPQQLSWTSPSPPPPRTWRVVRFPGWPHGNRTHNGSTSAACKAREVGRGDPTCPPPRALSMRRALWAPYGLSRGLWLVTRGSLIRNARFALLPFSLHFPSVQVSIISMLPADFDRQFDYRCHSRHTRDFGVRSHASFSRAIHKITFEIALG